MKKLIDLFKKQKLVAFHLLDMTLEKFCLFFERSNSRLRRRRRYGERDLEQVNGARRRSLVRHRLDMGIQPP